MIFTTLLLFIQCFKPQLYQQRQILLLSVKPHSTSTSSSGNSGVPPMIFRAQCKCYQTHELKDWGRKNKNMLIFLIKKKYNKERHAENILATN